MSARQAMAVLGLTGGLLLLGPAAWADETGGGATGDGQTSSAPADSPTDTPTDQPMDTPTDTPTDQPMDTPTDTPTDDPTDPPKDDPTDPPSGEPIDPGTDDGTVCGGVVMVDPVSNGDSTTGDGTTGDGTTDYPAPDGGDGTVAGEGVGVGNDCVLYTAGSGGGGEVASASERDTTALGSGAVALSGQPQLPLTGVPVGALSLVGFGLVALGSTSVLVGRR